MATVSVESYRNGALVSTQSFVEPAEIVNAATLQARAAAALTANATFLAIASPTQAQTLAHVQRLTKENNALIRLALGLLSDISDTA